MPTNIWILCGKQENWNIALKDGIWGLTSKLVGKWKYLKEGDWLIFYANNPIAGIIGLGKMQAKFKQNQPLWPDEISKSEVLYPYRFEFQAEYVLPETQWKNNKIKINLPIGFYSGINLFDDQDLIDEIERKLKKQWNEEYSFKESSIAAPKNTTEDSILKETVDLSHDKVKDMIFEIGKIHHYITDKEYAINSDRLDVVWRKVEKSVPTYAFEVQIGGDIYHALGKLKHAYDIWNSNIYIVIDEKHRNKIEELLAGTFHEITNIIKIINLSQINELYDLQINDVKLRKKLLLP
jgi:predicted RNA-binding protein